MCPIFTDFLGCGFNGFCAFNGFCGSTNYYSGLNLQFATRNHTCDSENSKIILIIK